MKSLRATMLAIFALAATSGAQTGTLSSSETLPSEVVKARCPYTPADESCVAANDASTANQEANGGNTLAQLPRRVPSPPMRPRPRVMGYPRPAYAMAPPTVSGRHVAIGAAIGLTLGLVAASHSSKNATALCLMSTGVGAMVGLMVPAFPARPSHWPDDDDDEQASGHHSSRHRPYVAHKLSKTPPAEVAQAGDGPIAAKVQ